MNAYKKIFVTAFLGFVLFAHTASAVALGWCISAVGDGPAWAGSPLCRSFGSGNQDRAVWWYNTDTHTCEPNGSPGMMKPYIENPEMYCSTQFNNAMILVIQAFVSGWYSTQ